MLEGVTLIINITILVILVLIYKELINTKKPVEHTNNTEYIMSDEDKEEFLKADAEATKSFYSALSNLNSFMTGEDYGEEIRNVGQQDK